MFKHTLTLGLMAAALLTGCGKNPATMTPQRTVSFKKQLAQSSAPKASTPVATPKGSATQPGVRVVSGAQAPVVTPSTATIPRTGAMSLRVRTMGERPVGSLLLNIASRVDPSQVALVPLAMNGAEAAWQHDDLLPGAYDLNIEVRDPAGKTVGSGTTQAQVVAGELAAVTLDITVEASAAPVEPPATTPGGSSGAADAPPDPEPQPDEPATDPVDGIGGTLGVRVEFL